MEKEIWTTRVEHLMTIFRDSLLALIPHLEAARIPWREEEAYDEWASISEALFENIVLRSIRWGVAGVESDFAFPTYGHVHGDYEGRALIEVFNGEPPESPRRIFFSRASRKSF